LERGCPISREGKENTHCTYIHLVREDLNVEEDGQALRG